MPSQRLTPTLIKKTEPTGKKFYLWDSAIPGFGVRITPAGSKSFVMRIRVGGRAGRQTERVISKVPAKLTTEDLNEVRAGMMNEKMALKGEDQIAVNKLTFAEAVDEYLAHLMYKYSIPKEMADDVHRWPHHPRAVAYSLKRCVNLPPKTTDKAYNYWKTHGRPYHAGKGSWKLIDINSNQIAEILNQIAQKSPSSARHVRANLHAMWGYFSSRSKGYLYNVVGSIPVI